VPEPSATEVEVAIRKLKRYKAPGSDQIPAELIQAGGKHYILRYINLLYWSGTKKNCLTSGKSQIVVPIHKKGDKTDCTNYRGISLLSTSYKILSNILLSRVIPYADEIIGDHQCGFLCNRSTTDQIFYIRQILEKKREYNGTVHQLFIDFKKTYDSGRREALYNILIEFGIPRKLVGLINMCLNETYSRVCIGKKICPTSLPLRVA
jgi:hypothetical protein